MSSLLKATIASAVLLLGACADLKVVRYDPLILNHVLAINECKEAESNPCRAALDQSRLGSESLQVVEVKGFTDGPHFVSVGPDDLKRSIGVFFDGTAANYKTQTNVRRLFETLASRGEPSNVLFYAEGVGAYFERMIGTPVNWASVAGWGISRDLREAYRFVAENYRHGGEAGRRLGENDRVAIFGFSRGAFAARSLAGFLEFYGGVPDLTPCRRYEVPGSGITPISSTLYLREDTTILCDQDTNAFTAGDRQRLVADLYRLYRDYGRACGKAKNNDAKTLHCRQLYRDVLSKKSELVFRPVSVDFVGIWDTVRTLGAEVTCLLRTDAEYDDHTLHQTDLYPSVRYARHALAADEQRGCFAPRLYQPNTLFDSMTALTRASAPDRLKEVWFVGDHSGVGGGHSDHKGLAGFSLNWMASEINQYTPNLFAGGLVPQHFYEEVISQPIHDLTVGRTVYQPSTVRSNMWSKALSNKNKLVVHYSLICRALATPKPGWPAYTPRSWAEKKKFPRNLQQLMEVFAVEPEEMGRPEKLQPPASCLPGKLQQSNGDSGLDRDPMSMKPDRLTSSFSE